MPTKPEVAVRRAIHHAVFKRTKDHIELRPLIEDLIAKLCESTVDTMQVAEIALRFEATNFYRTKIVKYKCRYCGQFHRNLDCTLKQKRLDDFINGNGKSTAVVLGESSGVGVELHTEGPPTKEMVIVEETSIIPKAVAESLGRTIRRSDKPERVAASKVSKALAKLKEAQDKLTKQS